MTSSVVSSSSTTRTRRATGPGSGPTAPLLDLPPDLRVVPREQPLVAALVEGEDGHMVDRALVARGGQEIVERRGEVGRSDGRRVVAQREPIRGGHRELDVAARVAFRACGERGEVGDGGGQLVL